jgi:proteasome alpha subunit
MPEVRVVISEEMDLFMNTVVDKGMFGSKAELIRASLVRYIETLPIRVPSGYDDATVYSPDGRILQIEYALESAKRGATIVGLRYKGGVILAKDKPKSVGVDKFPYIVTGPWLDFQVDKNIGMVPTGLSSDFIVLKNEAKKVARLYRKETNESITIEELVIKLSVFLHGYTTKKDTRPLGCVFLIGGVDKTGCHLFRMDPMGAYMEVLVDCFGSKMKETNTILKENYQADLSFKEALGLTVKAVLRDKKRKPAEIAATVIETETATFRIITQDEIKKTWDTVT